jgi:hypothetical protein
MYYLFLQDDYYLSSEGKLAKILFEISATTKSSGINLGGSNTFNIFWKGLK